MPYLKTLTGLTFGFGNLIISLQAMVHMLLNKESRDSVEKAKKLKSDDRKQQLKTLQSQHKNWKSNPRADTAVLQGILKQGTRQCKLKNSSNTSNWEVEKILSFKLWKF